MTCRMAMIALAVCLGVSPPAFATSRRDELKKTETDIVAAKAKQEELAGQSLHLQRELANMQQSLADTAQNLQQSERDLTDAEEKLVILQSQLDEKTLAMNTRRKDIATMLSAALRLSQTPPEAAMMMPGDLLKTLKSVRAVDAIAHALKVETESLSRQLVELEKLKGKVERGKQIAKKQREALALKQVALQHDIETRQVLVKKLSADQEISTKELAAMAQKASTLKDLISSIETTRREENRAKPKDTPSKRAEKRPQEPGDQNLRSFTHAKGKIKLPVAGTLLQGYGVALNMNETTRGLTLRTPSKASVIAPFDAEVVYAGSFLNYGKLVILRHRDDFHTLISGLARLDISAGQFLLEGEPIGAMGDRNSGDRLYLELRQNNQPIDPADWMDLNRT